MSQNQSHVYEVDVQSSGRLVLDQCDSPNPVAMQLFSRRTNITATPSVTMPHSAAPTDSELAWELVRGFDDERCNDRNKPAHVTWWLDPGQHALVVDYTAATAAATAVNASFYAKDHEDGPMEVSPLVIRGAGSGVPLNACEGDCHNDTDCATGLYCLSRDSSSSVVPGCDTGGTRDLGSHSYCYNASTSLYWPYSVKLSIAGHAWTDPYGLGLSNATLRRIHALSDTATTNTTAISGLTEVRVPCPFKKWGGMAYAPSTRMLYAAPRHAQSVLIIDPLTETADNTTMAGLGDASSSSYCDGDADDKWRSIAFVPSVEKLFAAPYDADSVLIIDPATNATDDTTLAGFGGGRGKWSGIAYAPTSGKLYAAPFKATSVLIIDPAARTTDVTTMAGFEGDSLRWWGIVYAPTTRKLYAAPMSAPGILIVDPLLNTTDITAMAGFETGSLMWTGIVYAPTTGKLYAAPLQADGVLIVDPATNTTDITTMAGFADHWKWNDIAFSPSTGLLYASPRSAVAVLIIDPWENTTDVTAMAGHIGTDKWDGLAFAPSSNKLFAAPNTKGSVLVISHTASVDACATNSPCARTCRASGCGWDDDRVLCLSGRTTTDAATHGNYGIPETACAPFELINTSACAAELDAPNYTLVGPTQKFGTDQSVNIPGPGDNCSDRDTAFASPTLDAFSAIGFDLVIARHDGDSVDPSMVSCTNPTTGNTTIRNLVAGNYTATLMALDGGVPPQTVTLTSFLMEVKNHTLAVTDECRTEQSQIEDRAVAAEYFVGDGVSIRGFSEKCDFSAAFEGAADPEHMFFRLMLDNATDATGTVTPFNGTMLIDGVTGEMLVNAKRGTVGLNYTAQLIAVDGARMLTVAEWSISPKLHSDLDSASNGPNGRDCARGNQVDGDPFDGLYTCDCGATGYKGKNCADADASSDKGPPPRPPPDSDDSADSAGVAMGVLTAVLFIVVAVAVAYRVQLYRIKYRPVDMYAMQTEVLEGMGMAQPKEIGDHEFGILLTTGTDPTGVTPVPETVVQQLVASVAKIVPGLAAELPRARVTIAKSNKAQFLLVIQRPHGSGAQSDVAERAVAAISRHVQRHKAHAPNLQQQQQQLTIASVPVTAASLAVPHRTPRELGRNLLTRMAHLGKGAFGEVDLYQVDELRQLGVPPYRVAAKTVKLGSPRGLEELLKEAALMAVLQHRNVLALVGVVTAPRDLPALILLEYCEGGELLKRVKDTRGLNTTKRLTYSAQVALGMQYVATRNIVHRDLAARNVLLAATGVCKVADFGMSASLVQKGKTYAAEYIRMHEEVALRWAAPEALQQKFSAASDVWAYGVTVWEIFSAGAEPYASLGLGEIGAFVRGGGRLEPPSPDICPAEVFTVLIAPCWAADPMERPSFDELYDVAVQEGGLEDAVARDERHQAQQRRQHEREASRERQGQVDRSLLGPSVHHITTGLVPAVMTAVPTIKNHAQQNSFDTLSDPGEATIWHMVHAYAKPASAGTVCPRDGTMGCAYVDTLTHEDDVGPATALLSYSWGYRVTEVADALSGWTTSVDYDPKRANIWICSLCLNQHLLSTQAASPEALAAEFGDRVVAIGRILPMLEPWDDPGYVKRAWCLFELYTAIRLPQNVEIDIILSPCESESFHDAIVAGGYSVVDGALEHIHAESATASVQADLDAIRALIRGYAGGFNTLNETVRAHLAHWFENHGGIKVWRKSTWDQGASRGSAVSRASKCDRAARVYPWRRSGHGSASTLPTSPANNHGMSGDAEVGFSDVNAEVGFLVADTAQAGAQAQQPPLQPEAVQPGPPPAVEPVDPAGFGLGSMHRFGFEV